MKKYSTYQDMHGSKNFVRGSRPICHEKALTFFSPQLISQKSNGYFKESYNFPMYRGPTFSRGGGSNFFQGGGGPIA